MSFDQLKMLVIHPEDPQGKIIPQLHEVVAWLAEMSSSVFDYLVQTEPDLLLRSPVATGNVSRRSNLVKALLDSCEKGSFHPREFGTTFRYKKLDHLGLADQLKPYLIDKTKSLLARQLAIDIVQACELGGLQDELATISLDQEEITILRKAAAYALREVGNETANHKLLPLALGEAGDDQEDELKGCGLRAVWPGGISAEQLFDHLTAPKRESFLGAYRYFLSSELAEGLRPTDLVHALKWVTVFKGLNELPHHLDDLAGQILKKAWEHIDVPGVAEAFGLAALSRLRHYDVVVGGRYGISQEALLASDDAKRQKVINALLPHLINPESDLACLTATRDPLVRERDFHWMMERLRRESVEGIQRAIVRLIHYVFDRSDYSHFEAVYSLGQIVPLLGEAFAWLLKPIILGSPEAEELKNVYRRRQEILHRKAERPALDPPPAERVKKMLEEFESGEPSAWWRLNMELTLEPTSTHYSDELEPDITTLPGWVDADMETRLRIISAAKRYIQIQDPHTPQWLGTNIIHRPAFAGYRALVFLSMTDLSFISAISMEVWERWAPIILAYPSSALGGKEQLHLDLVKLAYTSSPEAIIRTLIVLIDAQNRDHGDLFITRKMEECWDRRLCSALAAKLTDQNLGPKCVAQLLSDLIGRDILEARLFAEGLLSSPIASSGDLREKSVAAARVLLTKAKDAGWSVIWPIFQQDPVFGKEVVSAIDPYRGENPTWCSLKEDHLADLFIWLARQFSHSTDPSLGGAHWVGPNDRARGLRDGVLNVLKLKGTFDACEALRRVRRELPQLDWLKWVQADAELQARRESWIPPQPRHLLSIFRDHEKRLVQSGEHLLQVIKESLERLEPRLHGETPSVQFLWIPTGRGKSKPRDESDLSDFLKLHLEEDLKARGIIVNREVQIHKKEKTDIHVDTFVRSIDGQIIECVSVIIEVKGSWHQELDTAMQTQLKEQYLTNNHCQHGLYLVGWFNCDQWDEQDYRKARAPKLRLEEAQDRFAIQAKNLSLDGVHIEAFILDTSFA